MFCSQNLEGILNVALSLRGVHVVLIIFRGVRVLRPLATNLRDPPLGVFHTFSIGALNGLFIIKVV